MNQFANFCFTMLWSCVALGGTTAIARAASGPQAPEVKVVRAGKVELHYVEQGRGVPIVFVHGSVDDYRSFEPQLAPLSQNYRVISYSRR